MQREVFCTRVIICLYVRTYVLYLRFIITSLSMVDCQISRFLGQREPRNNSRDGHLSLTRARQKSVSECHVTPDRASWLSGRGAESRHSLSILWLDKNGGNSCFGTTTRIQARIVHPLGKHFSALWMEGGSSAYALCSRWWSKGPVA